MRLAWPQEWARPTPHSSWLAHVSSSVPAVAVRPTGDLTAPSSWACTDGVPTLPFPRSLIPVILIAGCGFGVGEVRGQGEAPDAVRPAQPAREKAGGAETKRQHELDRTVRQLRDLSLAQAQAQERGGPGPELD